MRGESRGVKGWQRESPAGNRGPKRVWVGKVQPHEVWGAQQGEGTHLDVQRNCLVDERLVESGSDTPD